MVPPSKVAPFLYGSRGAVVLPNLTFQSRCHLIGSTHEAVGPAKGEKRLQGVTILPPLPKPYIQSNSMLLRCH